MLKPAQGTILTDNLSSFTPEQSFIARKVVSTSENGKKYLLLFAVPKRCAVYQVDGNIVTTGDRCDKFILVEEDALVNRWNEIFVELKGRDVGHAIKQLRSSLQAKVFMHPTIGKRYARIVAQCIPRNSGNSIIERARDEFRKNYSAELKCWSSGKTDSLS